MEEQGEQNPKKLIPNQEYNMIKGDNRFVAIFLRYGDEQYHFNIDGIDTAIQGNDFVRYKNNITLTKFSDDSFSDDSFSDNSFSDNSFSDNSFSENSFSDNSFSGAKAKDGVKAKDGAKAKDSRTSNGARDRTSSDKSKNSKIKRKHEEEDDECIICLDKNKVDGNCKKGYPADAERCTAKFHNSCVKRWFATTGKSECPHCKRPLRSHLYGEEEAAAAHAMRNIRFKKVKYDDPILDEGDITLLQSRDPSYEFLEIRNNRKKYCVGTELSVYEAVYGTYVRGKNPVYVKFKLIGRGKIIKKDKRVVGRVNSDFGSISDGYLSDYIIVKFDNIDNPVEYLDNSHNHLFKIEKVYESMCTIMGGNKTKQKNKSYKKCNKTKQKNKSYKKCNKSYKKCNKSYKRRSK